MAFWAGGAYENPSSKVPVSALTTTSSSTTGTTSDASGRTGGTGCAGFPRARALVRSPTVLLRQVETFGTGAPKIFSMRNSVDVWSNTSVAA